MKLKEWIETCRPKTLTAAVAPVMIGTAMALADGKFHLWVAIATLLSALCIQIGTNFFNDYFDVKKGTDRSDRKGPLRPIHIGLGSPEKIKTAAICVFIMAALLGIVLISRGGLIILVIGIASIAAGILYTGGPKPLGYLGLGDLFVFIFFGPVATAGTYFVQALSFDMLVLVASIAPGLLSTAILVVNNIRDRETDNVTHKRTLAVRFGLAFSRKEYLFCILGATLVPFVINYLNHDHPFSLVASAILFLALPLFKTVFQTENGSALNGILAKTGKLLMIYSVLFSIGWILN
jgi:1,4-dihydroxy-2-naphthoate octaprenyltransferase